MIREVPKNVNVQAFVTYRRYTRNHLGLPFAELTTGSAIVSPEEFFVFKSFTIFGLLIFCLPSFAQYGGVSIRYIAPSLNFEGSGRSPILPPSENLLVGQYGLVSRTMNDNQANKFDGSCPEAIQIEFDEAKALVIYAFPSGQVNFRFDGKSEEETEISDQATYRTKSTITKTRATTTEFMETKIGVQKFVRSLRLTDDRNMLVKDQRSAFDSPVPLVSRLSTLDYTCTYRRK